MTPSEARGKAATKALRRGWYWRDADSTKRPTKPKMRRAHMTNQDQIAGATIDGALTKYLCKHGLMEDDAAAVMDAFKADEMNEVMRGRWDTSVEGYLPGFVVTLIVSLHDFTAGWLAEFKPRHWARPIFAPAKDPR